MRGMFKTKIMLDRKKADEDDVYDHLQMQDIIRKTCEECDLLPNGEPDTYELYGENEEPYPREHHATLYLLSEFGRLGHIVPCIAEWKFYDDHQDAPNVFEEDMLEIMRKDNHYSLSGIPAEEQDD